MNVGDLVLHRSGCRALVLDIVPGDPNYRGDNAVKVCWFGPCTPTTAGWAWIGTRPAGSIEWVSAGSLEVLTPS